MQMDDDVVHAQRCPNKGKAPMQQREIELAPIEINLADLRQLSGSPISSSEATSSSGVRSAGSDITDSTSDVGDATTIEFFMGVEGLDSDLSELSVEAQRIAWERAVRGNNNSNSAAPRPSASSPTEEEWPFEFVVDGIKSLFKKNLGQNLTSRFRKLKAESNKVITEKIKPSLRAMREVRNAGPFAYQPPKQQTVGSQSPHLQARASP